MRNLANSGGGVAAPCADGEGPFPLVVDLDGTLVNTDLLYESFFGAPLLDFRHFAAMFVALRDGKAQLKAFLARASSIDYAALPYNERVIRIIDEAREQRRPVYLATASDERHAYGVARHLGCFDGVFASDGERNLSGEEKAKALVEAFGENRFDYIGDSRADLAVWSCARQAFVVGAAPSLVRAISRLGVQAEYLARPSASLQVWAKALRIHQYTKNVLVFVPLLTSHSFTLAALLHVLLAFIAFSLCASSVYILNDLIDLGADRRHPTKRDRPFASGALPVAKGLAAAPVLLLAGIGIALSASPALAGVLAVYFALTLAYSVKLKRKLLVDVIVLSLLYIIRVVAGAVALNVVVSEWLLAFSLFMFTSLALIKRYVELAKAIEKGLPNPTNRNYQTQDLPIGGALAAASGFNAITIFTLYISSPAVRDLYRHPTLLWLICPILLYWIGRALVLAHRRLIDDDPIQFALRDRVSRLAGALTLLIIVAAM
jgi:4-hydroxybenzoate polyprenyltransferase